MGIGTIMSAKKIIMVVTGSDKKDILEKSFWGKVDPQIPASILQFHPDVTVICDEAAYPF
jgi:glucosamine-6-phosphate deaminase